MLIRSPSPPPRVSRFDKRNLYSDGRALAQGGFDIQGAAYVGGSLLHAEQAEAAFSSWFGRVMLRFEADPVVIDRQLNQAALLGQANGNVAGARVLLHVF